MSKKSKRRHCPALGTEITSQECGADRISRIACKADCPFNTFAVDNYADFSEAEERVLDKIRQRLLKWLTPERASALASRLDATGSEPARSQHHYMQEMFHTKNREGQTFWQAWEAEDWQGLNNDERIIAEAHSKTRTVLLEMHQVLTPDSFEAVDLLRPEDPPLVIADHSTTSQLRRFQAVITWVYPLPHFWRLSGAGALVNPEAGLTSLEVCHEIARHLGGPAETSGLGDWLWQNFLRWSEAHAAMISARWVAMMENIDAKSTKAEYAVVDFAGLCDLMEQHPQISEVDIDPEDAARGYERRYDLLEVSEADGMESFTGSVLLGKKKLRAEATSSTRTARLKAMLESLGEKHLRFVSENTVDLSAQAIDQRNVKWDASLVPPRLLEQPLVIDLQSRRIPNTSGARASDLAHAAFQDNLDSLSGQPIPALNGLTPEQAAQDPAMRPALIELMKSHLRTVDDMRQRKGMDVDINPLLESLGLHEIIFPAPPLPEFPAEADEGAEEEEYDDEPYDESPFSPAEEAAFSAPVKVKKLITPKMVETIFTAMDQDWPESDDMVDWLNARGAPVLDIFESPLLDKLGDVEFTILEMVVARAAYALCPSGWDDRLGANDRRFQYYISMQMGQLLKVVDSKRPDAVEKFAIDSPQPHLSSALCLQVLTISEHKDARLSDEKALLLLAFLKASIMELCAVLADSR